MIGNIHRLMIVSGALTMTMIYAAIAPDAALRSTFGEGVSSPAMEVVVRNWGVLIALMGALLVYAARKPEMRPLALAAAGASKLAFVALVLSHGTRFLGYQAGVAVVIDSAWVAVFAWYLWLTRRRFQVSAAP
jgi:hypothetical protein